MNLWPFSRKSADPAAEQQRILDALDGMTGATAAGIAVTPQLAMQVATVFAAVRVISEDVAKLPARLRPRDGMDKGDATGEPESLILSGVALPPSDSDDGYTSMECIEYLIASAALCGVGVAELNRVGGRAREWWPVRRGSWRHEARTGRWSILREGGGWDVVPRENLFVLRGPQLGHDVTKAAADAISVARALDDYTGQLAKRSGKPHGILSMPPMGSVEKSSQMLARLTQYFGPGGKGGLMPADVGKDMNLIQLSLSPQDLQVGETKKAGVLQIAAAFRVHPSRLMHETGTQTYASAYQFNIAHVTDTVMPWVKRFCQSFDKDVLRDRAARFKCEIELKGLLTGSPEERANFLLKLRTMGALSPKGVAELEDMPTEGLSDSPAFPLLTNPPKEQGTKEPVT